MTQAELHLIKLRCQAQAIESDEYLHNITIQVNPDKTIRISANFRTFSIGLKVPDGLTYDTLLPLFCLCYKPCFNSFQLSRT